MSRAADALFRALRDIEQLLEHVEVGPPGARRRVRRIDLALDNARVHVAERLTSGDSTRGGSSSIVEAQERAEERRVHHQALCDLPLLRHRPDDLARVASELYLVAMRQTATIDPSKLPSDPIPQCVSCKREKWDGTSRRKIGGHFAPVREDVKRYELCDWCYRHAAAAAKEEGAPSITRSHWPSIEACEKRHTVSPTAAGRQLAQERAARQRGFVS